MAWPHSTLNAPFPAVHEIFSARCHVCVRRKLAHHFPIPPAMPPAYPLFRCFHQLSPEGPQACHRLAGEACFFQFDLKPPPSFSFLLELFLSPRPPFSFPWQPMPKVGRSNNSSLVVCLVVRSPMSCSRGMREESGVNEHMEAVVQWGRLSPEPGLLHFDSSFRRRERVLVCYITAAKLHWTNRNESAACLSYS